MRALTGLVLQDFSGAVAGFPHEHRDRHNPRRAAARSPSPGLLLIMPLMRFWPDCGTHCVTEIACSARARSVSPDLALPLFSISRSIAMNHCGVLRKITGFLERQECGY